MPTPARRMRFTTWRPLATAATVAAHMATFLPSAVAATATPRRSEPVHSYDNAIREAVRVDTGMDGDSDGKTDRVAVDIVRPSEPAERGRNASPGRSPRTCACPGPPR